MEGVRLPKCSGADGDWPTFKFKFESYLVLNGLKHEGTGESNPEKNEKIYYSLGLCLEGRAMGILNEVEKGKGLEAWAKLKNYYESSSHIRKFGLYQALHTSKMKKGDSVGDFIQGLEGLQRSLKDIGCSFNDDMLLQVLIGGVSSEYNSILTSLRLFQDEVTFAKAKAILLSHEETLKSKGITETTTEAFVAFQG